MVTRFGFYMLNLDTLVSSDPKNTRLCLVVSPDEMNEHLDTAIIAPITGESPGYPTRIAAEVLGKERFIALDQIRTVESVRLFKKIGEINDATRKKTIDTLQEMFAE